MFGFGIFELIIAPLVFSIIGGVLLYFAIRRVRKKFGPSHKFTTWESINKLGCLGLIGVLLIAYAGFIFVLGMLSFVL